MNEENKCVICGHAVWKHVVDGQDVTWRRVGWIIRCVEIEKDDHCSCGAVAWTY